MKFFLFGICFFEFSFGVIKYNPIISLEYLSAGSDLYLQNNEIKIFSAGLHVLYKQGNLNVDAKFINNRLYGTNNSNYVNSFNKSQGFSWAQDPTGSGKSFDYDNSNLDIRYKNEISEFFFGKMNPVWGEGKSRLMFSDKVPSFPLFGFNWQVKSNIAMEYFTGQLRSDVPNTILDNLYSSDRKRYMDRNVAAHRFVWYITDQITLNAMESVIYAGRGIDLHYLMPFIPFWSIQHYLGDTDNIQMAGELIFSLSQNRKFYGSIFMDEWSPDKTFDKNNRNWFGYQAGLLFDNIITMQDELVLEYTWTDARIYRHRFEVNDFYSHGYPIGFWAGPHAEEIFFSYTFTKYSFDYAISFSNAKRGLFSDLVDQYATQIINRYDKLVENKFFIELGIVKSIYKDFTFQIDVSLVDWSNGGFDPSSDENQELINIQKTSFNIGFGYNY